MLSDLLGDRPGILERLHEEHEEAASLLERISEAESAKERTQLFAELREKLTLHLRAEAKVLYSKLAKDEESHEFALEGNIEHDLTIQQMEELARSRNKASDEWLARAKVLKDLVAHHVEEEESRGFPSAKRLFDGDELEKLADAFEREKERLARPRRAAAAEHAYAGSKPRKRAAKRGSPRKAKR